MEISNNTQSNNPYTILLSMILIMCMLMCSFYVHPRRTESTIDSEGSKGGTRGAPIMPRDAVSRTANEKLVTIVANRHYYRVVYLNQNIISFLHINLFNFESKIFVSMNSNQLKENFRYSHDKSIFESWISQKLLVINLKKTHQNL